METLDCVLSSCDDQHNSHISLGCNPAETGGGPGTTDDDSGVRSVAVYSLKT